MATGVAEIEHWGSGRPLVLIHGSPGNANSWKGVASALKDDFAMVAPTLPGHEDGARPEDAEAMSTDAIAATVEAALPVFERPPVLAGHSFGGSVALHVAMRGQLQIERLILFEPVAIRVLAATGQDDAHAEIRKSFDAYLKACETDGGKAVGIMIDFWFGAGAFEAMPEPMRAYLSARTPVNARDVRASFAETYSAADLGRVTVPVRVAWGGISPPVARTIAEALAGALPGGETISLAGANHAMLAIDPDAVARAIDAFAP